MTRIDTSYVFSATNKKYCTEDGDDAQTDILLLETFLMGPLIASRE